jgi:hypothetical protein
VNELSNLLPGCHNTVPDSYYISSHSSLIRNSRPFWNKLTVNYLFKIWGFHGDDYEEYCLLGCSTVWLCSHLLTCDLVLFTCPEDGGNMFPQNVCSDRSHMVLHLRRWYSSMNYLISFPNPFLWKSRECCFPCMILSLTLSSKFSLPHNM